MTSQGRAFLMRWPLTVLCAAALAAGTSGLQQAVHAQGQQQQQQMLPSAPAPPPDPFKYDADSALVIIMIAEPAAPDFEKAMTRVKEVLAASDKPERKQQAAHWKVTKGATQNGMVMYIFTLDVVVREASYNPFAILGEGGVPAEEVRALYDSIAPNIKAINPLPYHPLVDMGSGG